MSKSESAAGDAARATTPITADIAPGATGYFGCVEAFHPEIRGWVVNSGAENTPVAIEILIDGERAATAYCVQSRVDIATITGRSNTAGFSVPVSALKIPPHVRRMGKDASVELTFRIKGTNYVVLPLFEARVPVAQLVSEVERAPVREMSKSELGAAIQPYLDELPRPEVADPAVKVIAFYLPQFHPVPENNEWWGPGFTEWTNVTQAKPQYKGHYQPRVPSELGYYDLRLPEVREAQAELAREHGVYGFCYYYYWFNGRKILERPLQEVLESGKPDFPFCICWANETWSRRWDGSEDEVLLKQQHTPASDVEFIHDVIPFFKDPRYIRVNGAPLLLVYRASLFPDLRTTADTWRRVCAENGIPEVHLCIVESFGFSDPYSVGFDSSVQFPPHGISSTDIRDQVDDLEDDFDGRIYDYAQVVQNEICARQPDYRRFRGVMCSWDNTARRKNRAHIFENADPSLYEVWLRDAVDWTRTHHRPGERLVFVNAWNEWAEGTYLEPDTKNGRAYLEATRRVVSGRTSPEALIEHARTAGELSGERLENWLREVQARLDEAAAVRDFAYRIVKRNHALLDGGSLMTSIEPYVLHALPMINIAKANIDRLNGVPAGIIAASVRRDQPLYVEGWCVHPSADVDPRTISYFVMENVVTKQRFYAPVFGRHPRSDVAAAHADLPESRTLYSGFKVYLGLAELERGEYRLGVLQVAGDSVSLNFTQGIARVS